MPECVTPAYSIGGGLGNMALKFSFTDGSFDKSTLTSKISWTLKGYGTGNTTASQPYVYVKNIELNIDGEIRTYWTTSQKLKDGVIVASGNKVVQRDRNGYKDLSVSISAVFAGTTTKSVSETFTLARIEPLTKPPIITNLTATPTGANATVNSWGIFLQGYSKGNATATVTAQNGTITSTAYTINGKGAGSLITESGVLPLKCVAWDSYGNSAEASSTITVEPYSSPVITEWSAFRCDENGNATQKGKYIKLKCVGGISSCGGHNALTITAEITNKTTGATDTVTVQSGVEQIVGGAYSSTTAYSVKFNVTDAIPNTTIATITVPVEDVGLNFRFFRISGKSGAAVFDFADTPGVLKVNGKIAFPGSEDNSYHTQAAFITHSGFMPNIGYVRRYDDGTIEVWGYKQYIDLDVVDGRTLAQDISLTGWDESICPAPVHPVCVSAMVGKYANEQSSSYVGTTANIATFNSNSISVVIGNVVSSVLSCVIYYRAIYLDYQP